MTTTDKIKLLSKEPPQPCCLADYYYDLFDKMGDIKRDYGSYMITEPINCNEELKRVGTADYDLCCALLTMLLREDHFAQYGCFDNRYKNGDVQPIITRMIELLKASSKEGIQ